MVYRMQLTYDENIEISDLKHILSKRIGCSLNPDIYEITYRNKTLEHFLPDNMKVTIKIDGFRLKSNPNVNQTLIFTTKYFLCTVIGFTQ